MKLARLVVLGLVIVSLGGVRAIAAAGTWRTALMRYNVSRLMWQFHNYDTLSDLGLANGCPVACIGVFGAAASASVDRTLGGLDHGRAYTCTIKVHQFGLFDGFGSLGIIDAIKPGSCVAFPATCSNGVQDAGETDVDCGGPCPPCPDQGACSTPADCGSGHCTLVTSAGCGRGPRICSPATCFNGVRDLPGEQGVDCGLACGTGCPAGTLCAFFGNCVCASGVCVSNSVCQ